jgi:hypothetical protein
MPVNEKYINEMLHPDWDGFRKFYGCEPPESLMGIYEKGVWLFSGPFMVDYKYEGKISEIEFIQYFMPINENTWDGKYGKEYFQFAVNVDGYPLLINPDKNNSVIYTDWETDNMIDIEEIRIKLKELVETIKNIT